MWTEIKALVAYGKTAKPRLGSQTSDLEERQSPQNESDLRLTKSTLTNKLASECLNAVYKLNHF